MAYNVKYRLEFSDVKGNLRKVEILRDNYIGSVLPMIGTGIPVEIDYKANDDEYNHIVGSTCTLNLMVTDTVTYDAFHTFDERTFKIRVSYHNGSSYSTYWEGFLVADGYKEAITTTPYQIALKATDGLGSLDAFDAPTSNASNTSNTDTAYHYISNILAQTDLGFSVTIRHDIHKSGSAVNTIFNDIVLNEFGLMTKKLTYRNSKQVLEAILKVTNSKVFQSNGQWWVVSNTNYGGSGDLSIPSDLIPLNKDLMVEYLRPIKKAIYKVELDDKKIINSNPHFLYGTHEWSVQSPSSGKYNAIVSDSSYTVKAASAGKYLHTNDIDSTGADVQCIAIPKDYNSIQQNKHMEVGFSYYIQNDGSEETYRFGVKVIADIDGSLPYEYYNFTTDEWENTSSPTDDHIKFVSTSTVNSWGTTKFDVKPYTNDTTTNNPDMIVILNKIQQGSGTGVGNYVKHYIDNFYLAEKLNIEGDYELEKRSTNDNITGVYESEKNLLSNKLSGTGFMGGFSGVYERSGDTSTFALEELLMLEVVNDYRAFKKRYEGTLYKNTASSTPLFYTNRIIVSFDDTDGCVIDSMRYDVKGNRYNITMTLPDQFTSDISSTTYERYE